MKRSSASAAQRRKRPPLAQKQNGKSTSCSTGTQQNGTNSNLLQTRLDGWIKKKSKTSSENSVVIHIAEENANPILFDVYDDSNSISEVEQSIQCCSPSQTSATCSDGNKKRPERFTPQAEFFSDIDDFPAITNRTTLLTTLSIKILNDEYAIELLCKHIGGLREISSSDIVVILRDAWIDTKICAGSTFRLIAPLCIKEHVFEVSSTHGLLILEPEILLSPTLIQQSLYCPRKAFFQDRFRGFPSGTALPLLLGSVVHELFQDTLVQSSDISLDSIFCTYKNRFLGSISEELNELDLSEQDFESTLIPYLKNSIQWIQDYVKSDNPLPLHKDDGCFQQVVDIEENYWSPTIGIKGKIDVSFKIHPHGKENRTSDMIYPLELKTGKSYEGSIEHQAQVLLYSLLLSERWNKGKIVPGFLLYLKDNRIRKIQPKSADLKGLIHLRNRIIPHFVSLTLDSIPDPLNEPRKCNGCPYTTMCGLIHTKQWKNGVMTGERHNAKDSLSKDMADFMKENIKHLKEDESNYAMSQLNQIFSEWSLHSESSSSSGVKLFRESPNRRQKNGTCMSNMILDSTTRQLNSNNHPHYLLKFCPRKETAFLSTNYPSKSPFSVGQCIIVSTEKSYALLMGTITRTDDRQITIKSDRTLDTQDATSIYHIDKYVSASSFTKRLVDLASLMENSQEMSRVRSVLLTNNDDIKM